MSDKDHRKTADHILKTAHKVVTTERGGQHGGAEDSFQMIADLWQTYLRNTKANFDSNIMAVDAYDVAQMMTLLKVARAVHGNVMNEDNYVDAAGYQSLAAAIAGIKAPVVQEPTTSRNASPEVEVKSDTRKIAEKFAPAPTPVETKTTVERAAISSLVSALEKPITE